MAGFRRSMCSRRCWRIRRFRRMALFLRMRRLTSRAILPLAGARRYMMDGWRGRRSRRRPVESFPAAATASNGLEVSFRPDTSIYDGRFANVGWMQELPKQITNLSWNNAAIMSINTMADLKLGESDPVKVSFDGREFIAPALMVPGHPDGVITAHLGFGRGVLAGRAGQGVGFDAYQIRRSDAPLFVAGVTAVKVPGTYELCITKVHNIEHRGSFAAHDLAKPPSDKEGVFLLG